MKDRVLVRGILTGPEETSDELDECRLDEDEDEDACVADSGVLNVSGERGLSVASLSSESLQSFGIVQRFILRIL